MIGKLAGRWKQAARRLKRETYALYLAVRDPRTPWYARAVAVCVVAYAFSPIDLIPDFIPVLGYLDDLVLVPLGVWLALRLIPGAVIQDCRSRADALIAEGKPVTRAGVAIIIAIWLFLLALAAWLILRASRVR
jgi:uncharacterized membrane protein YkvA (DUF1232 family)